MLIFEFCCDYNSSDVDYIIFLSQQQSYNVNVIFTHYILAFLTLDVYINH